MRFYIISNQFQRTGSNPEIVLMTTLAVYVCGGCLSLVTEPSDARICGLIAGVRGIANRRRNPWYGLMHTPSIPLTGVGHAQLSSMVGSSIVLIDPMLCRSFLRPF